MPRRTKDAPQRPRNPVPDETRPRHNRPRGGRPGPRRPGVDDVPYGARAADGGSARGPSDPEGEEHPDPGEGDSREDGAMTRTDLRWFRLDGMGRYAFLAGRPTGR